MAREFRIPIRAEDLQTRTEEDNPFTISTELRFSDDLAERVVHDVSFNEPMCIVDPDQFQRVYVVIDQFVALTGEIQSALVSGLSSSLKMLATTLMQKGDAFFPDQCMEMRSSIKALVFFLSWIWSKLHTVMEKHMDKTTKGVDEAFDWQAQIEETFVAFSSILSMDLVPLWEHESMDPRMLELCLTTSCQFLTHHHEVYRKISIKIALLEIFTFLAIKHEFLHPTANALLHQVQRNENLCSFVAEVTVHAQETCKVESLTEALIQEMTKASSQDYSQQWEASKGKSPSIKALAKLIESMGEVLADCLIKHSSSLEAYWSCTAYPLRNALISVMGAMIQALNHPNGRNQQHQMLDRLMQRFMDVNAFTRARNMSIWIQLVQRSCVPMEYWLELTRSALDRLRDCASTVRKASLALLQALLEYNPFGDNMNKDRFYATLFVYKKKLEDCPPDQRDSDDHQQVLFVVSNLETAVQFSELMEESLEESMVLLSSPSILVVQEVVHFGVVCQQFSVKSSEKLMKASFALVFSQESVLKEQIVEAFIKLYLVEGDDLKTAQNFVLLAVNVTIGELACLEEIIRLLLIKEKIKNKVIKALLFIALDKDTLSIPKQAKVQAATFLLSICAPYSSSLLSDHLDSVLQIAFVDCLTNGPALKYACQVLKSIGHELEEAAVMDVCSCLVQILFESHMPQASWFQVAEVAVGVVYSLFPQPDKLFEEILQEMATSLSTHSSPIHSISYLRFCFLLGEVAIHHMLYVDVCSEVVKGKLASKEDATSDNDEADDPMGTEISRQELELENLRNEIEKEILNPNCCVGFYASMISTICHNVAHFVECPVSVQISLSLALVKFMAIDIAFCEKNIQLFFTILHHKKMALTVRENLVIALSDLIVRFPNLMEPWTPKIYDLLSAEETTIRRNTLLVLTHLILSDMIKVQGHISKIVILMREKDERLRTMAKTFINELHKKSTRTSNPIYNLFPDILSNFQQDRSLSSHDFQMIIQYILQFTNERHGEKLVEKLCLRFEGIESPEKWRGLSFSIKCLQFSEKGFHRLWEMLRSYRHSLGDPIVFQHLKETIIKLRRNAKNNDLKPHLHEFEVELAHLHHELKPDDDHEGISAEMEMEEASVADVDSELTLGRATDSSVDQNGALSDRKRKAEEQDELDRRSEMRLLDRASRLDRIPEKDRRSGGKSFSFGKGRKSSISIEAMHREEEEEASNEKRNFQSDDVKVERRLSRLSISEEMD